MTEVTRLSLDLEFPFQYREDTEGKLCYYADYANLKAERDALAAENAAQSSSLKALVRLNNRLWQWTSRMSYNASYVGEPEGMVKGHIREMEKILDATGKDTPATDAYLNSVRADAVQNLWNDSLNEVGHVLRDIGAYRDASGAAGIVHDEIKERVEDYANQLRAGKDGE